ncbi:hypothetical protein LTR27_008935 [Elasticomyces elasticus]|nr:hypothetical protein LTR27_008935 [Elasticomyces elasticus]
MAQSPVIDRYHRYKRGTDKLLDWLLESGKSIAKRTNANFSFSSKAVLQTQDLVTIADQIAHAKPPYPVPGDILLVASDVIDGRIVCAEWYASLEGDDELKQAGIGKSNRSHRHFIDILKHVHRLLVLAAPAKASTAKAKTRREKKAQDQANSISGNLFAYLELEEPTVMDAELAATVPATSNAVVKTKVKSKTRLDNTDEDLSFALWCFFQDANEVRQYVASVWKRYYEGELTFAVVTRVTETAFVMITEIRNRLVIEHDQFVSFDGVVKFLGISMLTSGKDTLRFKARPKAGDRVASKWQGAFDLMCIPAWCVLDDLVNNATPVHAHPFAITLTDMIPIFQRLEGKWEKDHEWSVIDGLHTDEYLVGILVMAKCGAVTISTVIQTQIYMDIIETLGCRGRTGLDYCKDVTSKLKDKTDAYVAFTAGRYHSDYPSRLQNFMGDMDKHLNIDKQKSEGVANTASYQTLLENLPLLPTNRINYIAGVATVYTCWAAGELWALLGVAHLYKAAQLFGVLLDSWPDMQFVIDQQGKHSAFVREATSIAGYARHFDMALGVPASAFSSRTAKMPMLPYGKKLLELQQQRIRPTSPFLLAQIEESKAAVKKGVPQPRPVHSMLETVARQSKGRAKGAGHSKTLPPTELLSRLTSTLVETEPESNFDYLGLFMRCQEFIVSLTTNFRDRLDMFPDDSGRPAGGQDIVHEVLWEAAAAGDNEEAKKRTILYEVGPALKRLIEEASGPDAGVKAAFEASSGHLLKDRWPVNKKVKKGGLSVSTRSIFDAVRDRANPNRHDWIAAEKQVHAELEAQQDKWTSNGMARNVLLKKSETFANSVFKKRGIPRRVDHVEDSGGRIKLHTSKLDESDIEQTLNRMQMVDQGLTLSELFPGGCHISPEGCLVANEPGSESAQVAPKETAEIKAHAEPKAQSSLRGTADGLVTVLSSTSARRRVANAFANL